MDISKYTFCVMKQPDIFIELREVSYDKNTGKLYYYDPRDDDIWPVERFIRELHGKDAKIENYLYVKDVNVQMDPVHYLAINPQFKNV
jgi:hypothetical protein